MGVTIDMVDRLIPYRKWLGDKMKPSGNGWFMAKCPSHDDKHNSLAVHQDGHHHCKANCGEKGDAYLIALKVGLDHKLYARGKVAKNGFNSKNTAINQPKPPSNQNDGVSDVYLNKKDTNDKKDTTSPQKGMDHATHESDAVIGIELGASLKKHHQRAIDNINDFPWNLNLETIKEYKLGLNEKNEVVIPIMDTSGRVVSMKEHKGKQWGVNKENKFYPAGHLGKGGMKFRKYTTDATLVICAGEKDCLILRQHTKYQAITVTGGEGSIPDSKYWKGVDHFKRYIIIYDNDATGKQGAEKMAREVQKRNPTADVKVAVWSKKCPDKWDVADSIDHDNGNTLMSAIDNAKPVKPKMGEFKMINPSMLKHSVPEPVKWFIKDKCPENYVSLVAGETNSNKSYFCMQEAMAIATGGEFLDGKATKPRKVLFVDTECGAESLTKRYLTLVESCNYDKKLLEENFRMISKRGSFTDAYPQIETYLNYLHPDLVYIDNIYTSTSTEDLSHNKNLKPLLENILMLMETYNCTVRLIAHFNKPSANREESFGISKIAGGAFLGNWCEFITVLCRTNQDNLRLMRVVKSRDSAFSNQVMGLEWCPDGNPKLVLDAVYDNWSYLLKDEGTMKHWFRILEDIAPKQGDKFDTNRWKNAVDADALCEVTDRTAERWLIEMETIKLVKNIGQKGRLRLWERTSLAMKDWGKSDS